MRVDEKYPKYTEYQQKNQTRRREKEGIFKINGPNLLKSAVFLLDHFKKEGLLPCLMISEFTDKFYKISLKTVFGN